MGMNEWDVGAGALLLHAYKKEAQKALFPKGAELFDQLYKKLTF